MRVTKTQQRYQQCSLPSQGKSSLPHTQRGLGVLSLFADSPTHRPLWADEQPHDNHFHPSYILKPTKAWESCSLLLTEPSTLWGTEDWRSRLPAKRRFVKSLPLGYFPLLKHHKCTKDNTPDWLSSHIKGWQSVTCCCETKLQLPSYKVCIIIKSLFYSNRIKWDLNIRLQIWKSLLCNNCIYPVTQITKLVLTQ